MTILVTGGAGYIGSHMVHALVDAGESVIVLDNLSTGFPWAVPKLVPLVVGETGDQALVAALIAEHGVESVIHFAASIVVPDSVADPLGYYRNNTVNSRALIETAIKGGVRQFIFSSTAAVYGNPRRIPINEDDAAVPMSPYGSSKLMTEIMLRDAGVAHGLNYLILRYFNVAGADPLMRAGQSTKGATHLIKVAVETALGLRPMIEVFGTDYETSGRHLHPRLYSRVGSGSRAFRRAAPSARRRRLGDPQLRLWPRLLGARRDRHRQARLGRRLQGHIERPPSRRSRCHRRGLRTAARTAGLGPAVRRS